MMDRFVLGTAQLGMDYGSVRRVPMPSEAEALRLVHRAVDLGVRRVDTARAYGLSEERLGRALGSSPAGAEVAVVTKLPALNELPADANPADVRTVVDRHLDQSRRALRRDVLSTVLLHWAGHRTAWGGIVWERLLDWRAKGYVGAAGVSVSSIDPVGEALVSLSDPEVQHLQIPCNILDHRWDEAGVPDRAAGRPDVVVDVRSVFLQGILLRSDPTDWPRIDGVEPAAMLGWLNRQARALGRRNAADLCLAYMRGHSWVHGLVIGVDSVDDLEHDAALFGLPPLDLAESDTIRRSRPPVPETLLRPGLWPSCASPDQPAVPRRSP